MCVTFLGGASCFMVVHIPDAAIRSGAERWGTFSDAQLRVGRAAFLRSGG